MKWPPSPKPLRLDDAKKSGSLNFSATASSLFRRHKSVPSNDGGDESSSEEGGEKEMVTETVSVVRRSKQQQQQQQQLEEQEEDADLRDLLHHIRRLDDRYPLDRKWQKESRKM